VRLAFVAQLAQVPAQFLDAAVLLGLLDEFANAAQNLGLTVPALGDES
jgi:hypothetical protein